MTNELANYGLLFSSALAAGAVNSIAGGGTLLTFPALLAVISPVAANATSTIALVPGAIASAWGFRNEIQKVRRYLVALAGVSSVGGIVGALLLTQLDPHYFDQIIPWLILLAALLFMIQPVISRLLGFGRTDVKRSIPWAFIVVMQFLVAIYGGYFGAGIGILMLAALSLCGMNDIHEMNAVKVVLNFCINGVATLVFIFGGQVNWRYAPIMAIASISGGYLGARTSRRMNRTVVRWLIILIGLGLSAYFFSRRP